ncbi:hypothetical protein ACNKHT_00325 [Shigella flexneri]
MGTEEIDTIIPVLDELRAGDETQRAAARPIPCFSRNISITPTPCWRCTTIRVFPC